MKKAKLLHFTTNICLEEIILFQIIVFKQLIWASKRDQSLKIRTADPLDVSTETKSKISHVSGTTVINTFSSPIAYFSNKVISKLALGG